VQIPAGVTARIFTDDEIRTGDQVTLSFDTRHVTLFDETGARIPAIGE
jgi:multiple sugar transport system ATP-binding protein